MIGVLVSIVVIVLLVALAIWAVGFLAQGNIPTTPYRAIVVLLVLVGLIAIIYSLKHPFINL